MHQELFWGPDGPENVGLIVVAKNRYMAIPSKSLIIMRLEPKPIAYIYTLSTYQV